MRGSKGHLKQEKGTGREAHVAVGLAALGRLPQRVEVGKGGNAGRVEYPAPEWGQTGTEGHQSLGAKRRGCLPRRAIHAVPAVQRAGRQCQAGRLGREARPSTVPDTLGLPLWLCLDRGAVGSADTEVGSQLQGRPALKPAKCIVISVCWQGSKAHRIRSASAASSKGCKYSSTVEETMDHTGAGRASCAGSGGRVAYLAEYRTQASGLGTPKATSISRQHLCPSSSSKHRQNSRYSA